MRFNKSLAFLLAIGFACSATGCAEIASLFNNNGYVDPNEKIIILEEMRGTVGELAYVHTGGAADVGGYGVCFGLGKNGSSEIPPSLEADLIKSLKGREGIGNHKLGNGGVSVRQVLKDKDTAIVHVSTYIPPGAPKGTYLDVEIVPAERTQTKNLSGGYLFTCDMSPKGGAAFSDPKKHITSRASAHGYILVNPFVDPTLKKNADHLRRGRIIGGAVTTRDMPIHLRLYRKSYSRCNQIARNINQRFNPEGIHDKVARAKTEGYIVIKVPGNYRRNYVHFLKLIEHMPRLGSDSEARKLVKRNIRMLANPKYSAESLCLTMEAIGVTAEKYLNKLLKSNNPRLAFYAARTIMRITDSSEADMVIMRFAKDHKSPYQLLAIDELGRQPDCLGSNPVLEQLLDSNNEKVRVAAYRALVKRGSSAKIRRLRVDAIDKRPSFIVDIVDSAGEFAIYATQTGIPKIVLFGKNMPIAKEIFYCGEGGVLTLNNKYGSVDKDRIDGLTRQLAHVNKKLAPYLMLKKKHQLASSNDNPKDTLDKTRNNDSKSPDLIDDDEDFSVGNDRNRLSDIQIKLLKEHKINLEVKLKNLQTRHLEVYRAVSGSRFSKKFRIDFKVLELIYTLGERPRVSAETGKIEGLGFTYGQVLRVLYLLTQKKNKFIPAKFILQPLDETQKMGSDLPAEGRPNL